MARSVFKKPALKTAYDTCQRLFAEGKFNEDAAPGEMYGVMHKAFWNGWHRRGTTPERGSPAYAAWAAGVDAKANR